jgi:hypothetical protein
VLLGKKEEEIFKKNDERKRSHTKRDTEREKKKRGKTRAPSIFSPFVSFARDVSACARACDNKERPKTNLREKGEKFFEKKNGRA